MAERGQINIDAHIVTKTTQHTLEDEAREEIPAEAADERIQEETLSRDSPSVSNATVALRMQRIEEGASYEVGGPNHRRR